MLYFFFIICRESSSAVWSLLSCFAVLTIENAFLGFLASGISKRESSSWIGCGFRKNRKVTALAQSLYTFHVPACGDISFTSVSSVWDLRFFLRGCFTMISSSVSDYLFLAALFFSSSFSSSPSHRSHLPPLLPGFWLPRPFSSGQRQCASAWAFQSCRPLPPPPSPHQPPPPPSFASQEYSQP
jgi:hypothetical protein